MSLNSFNEWIQHKRLISEIEDNPLLNMSQKEGDKVYFGIHDLNRHYKNHGSLPNLEFADVMDKVGEISDVDPVEATVLVSVEKAPYHYGYRNLQSKSARKQAGQVKIPTNYLVDISHLIEDEHKVWLVIDQKTKYQAGLMKQIRRKEMRAYMGADISIEDEPEQPYRMVNREIHPNFDPTVTGLWKRHTDMRRYNYYPET